MSFELNAGEGIPQGLAGLEHGSDPGRGFSAPMVLARILEGTAQPGTLSQSLASRVTCRDVACYVSTLGEAFNSLSTTQQDQIRNRWGSHLNEILSLSRETDAELFYEALFHLGQRLEREGHVEQAGLVYSAIVSATHDAEGKRGRGEEGRISSSPPPFFPSSSLLTQAQERMDILNGAGSMGQQMEHMGRGFARQAIDPGLLLGATGMGLFGKGVELIGMRYLAGANFFRRSYGFARTALEFAPRVTGFALEATAFPFAINGANELLGRPVSWAHMDHRIYGSWFFLGGMRVGNRLGASASRSLGVPGLQTIGSIAGVGLGHGGEVWAGLREWHGFSNFAVETFGTWATLQVAGRYSDYVFGGQISRMQRIMDLSIEGRRGREEERFGERVKARWAEWVQSVSEGFDNMGNPPMAASAAGVAPGIAIRRSPISTRSPNPLEENRSYSISMGDGRGGGSIRPRATLQNIHMEVQDRGKNGEIEALKDLVSELMTEAGRHPGENLSRYLASRDPQEWRLALQIMVPLLVSKADLLEDIQGHPRFVEFAQDWLSRPHFSGPQDIEVEFLPDAGSKFSMGPQLKEMQKAFFDAPNLRGWRTFLHDRRGRDKIQQMQEIRRDSGGVTYVGNWKRLGLIVRFDARENLTLPIQVGKSFSETEWQGRILELEQEAARGPEIQSAVLSLNPESGENPTQWVSRLMEISREAKIREEDAFLLSDLETAKREEATQLQIVQALEAGLINPSRREFSHAAIQSLVSLSASAPERKFIMARHNPVPGLKAPVTIVSPPTTFLPGTWSQFFMRGMVAEFTRTREKAERAYEVGSGTGWMTIVPVKLGMAREVTGVDINEHAPSVGRLNARLNSVEGVQFLISDGLIAISPESKADLIMGCVPQIPRKGPISLREEGDYYPSQNTYLDRFGLELVDRILGQAKERLTENGRVLFVLGGRPGRAMLEDMFMRRGLHPVVRYAELVAQDKDTSIAPLVDQEKETGHRFEFFLQDPSQPLSAHEVEGKEGVRHMLYLMEGRPYRSLFDEVAREALTSRKSWGYTREAGEEHEGLRRVLLEELSRSWGTRIENDALWMGPHYPIVLEGMLKILVPTQGRVLWVGPWSDWQGRIADQLGGRIHTPSYRDLNLVAQSLEQTPTQAAVIRMGRETWERTEELEELLRQAAAFRTHLIFVEPHPVQGALGRNALIQLLSRHPEYAEHVTILQPLEETFDLPNLPLTAVITGNSSLHLLLSRYGELTYSRVSTPLQESYARFLTHLQKDRLQGTAPVGSLSAIAGSLEGNPPVIKALESRSAFNSLPTGEHPNVIDMSFGESEATPSAPLHTMGLRHASLSQARQVVAKYLRESRGVNYEPEQIFLGAGVHPLIVGVIGAIAKVHSGRSLQVLLPKPSYGLFFPTVEVAGARLVEVPTFPTQRFLVDEDSLRRSFRPGMAPRPIRALLLNSPTNPGGQYYTEKEIAPLAEILRPQGDYLLWDDVFGQLRFNHRTQAHYLPVAQRIMGDQLVVFGGLSKEFAAGGVRFGFAATENPQLIEALNNSLMSPPDPFALTAAQEYLPLSGTLISLHQNYLRYRMKLLSDFFRERNIPFLEPQGGFSLFVELRALWGKSFHLGMGKRVEITPQNLHELLMTHAGIKIHSSDWARTSGHYRFVFSIERIEDAIARLKKFFRQVRDLR